MLKAGTDVIQIPYDKLRSLCNLIPKEVHKGRFYSAEGKVKAWHSSLWELKCSWVSLLGILIDQWSARIWKSHDLSSLVKCLPHSIVLGLPNHLHLKIVG